MVKGNKFFCSKRKKYKTSKKLLILKPTKSNVNKFNKSKDLLEYIYYNYSEKDYLASNCSKSKKVSSLL